MAWRGSTRVARVLLLVVFGLLTLTPLSAGSVRARADEYVPDARLHGDTQQSGNPNVFGIASHAWWLDPETYGDQLLPALDDLGVTTVRLSIDWRRFEATQGDYDWSLYDRVFSALAARNIVVVANFNTIPPWASTDVEGCADPALEIYACQLREDMLPAFEAAARAAVSRYAWIQYWEFWNEPEMWRYLGEDATVYLRHLRSFYDVAHAVNPEVVVCAQTLVGVEYMEYVYNLSDLAYGAGNEPWDAISIHPYVWNYTHAEGQRHLEINYDRIIALHDLMVRRGDGHKQVWITEYGWNNGVEQQAENIVYTLDWLKRQPYIGFAHLHMLHDWNNHPLDAFGLMRALPDGVDLRLSPPGVRFEPKQPFYDAFKNADRSGLPLMPSGPDVLAFPETGHTISGRFLKAWQERGALRILGLPLTRPYPRQQPDGSWLLVQDFERARLEFHPEHLGGWGEVLGTLAGREVAGGRFEHPAFEPLGICPSTPDRDCFAATGHSLAYGFREFWQAWGGLATFGYPISEEFTEDGLTVQYFERAVFEFHPEHAGTEFIVLPRLLIRDQLEADGWLIQDWVVSPDPLLPTAREFE